MRATSHGVSPRLYSLVVPIARVATSSIEYAKTLKVQRFRRISYSLAWFTPSLHSSRSRVLSYPTFPLRHGSFRSGTCSNLCFPCWILMGFLCLIFFPGVFSLFHTHASKAWRFFRKRLVYSGLNSIQHLVSGRHFVTITIHFLFWMYLMVSWCSNASLCYYG